MNVDESVVRESIHRYGHSSSFEEVCKDFQTNHVLIQHGEHGVGSP